MENLPILVLIKKSTANMKKSQKTREMTNEERWMAIGYLKANPNCAACASELGFSPDTIEKLYKKYKHTGNVEDSHRSGRPPAKNEEEKKKY